MFGRGGEAPTAHKILDENEIVDGIDELGVLIFGHARNAYWYGSQLSIRETRTLAPYQNATGLQVSSAVLAGMVWALKHPAAGIVATAEMDHAACPPVHAPYLRPLDGCYPHLPTPPPRTSFFPARTHPTPPKPRRRADENRESKTCKK